MDSGNDSVDNIAICKEQHVDFIIKRNLRKESENDWVDLAKEKGEMTFSNHEKTIYIGKTETDLKGNLLSTPIYFECTVITIKNDQYLIAPEIKVDTYWSSLNTDPSTIIALYHDHATSEQFHSELKCDMDLERLPSGNFSTNAFILLLGLLGYNMLRLCGQESLRDDNENTLKIPSYRKLVQRRRIRTVILDFIYVAGKIIHKSRQWFISFGKLYHFSSLWNNMYRRFMLDTR
jgi:hypothetical protein